jgi:hypothetical protein
MTVTLDCRYEDLKKVKRPCSGYPVPTSRKDATPRVGSNIDGSGGAA